MDNKITHKNIVALLTPEFINFWCQYTFFDLKDNQDNVSILMTGIKKINRGEMPLMTFNWLFESFINQARDGWNRKALNNLYKWRIVEEADRILLFDKDLNKKYADRYLAFCFSDFPNQPLCYFRKEIQALICALYILKQRME